MAPVKKKRKIKEAAADPAEEEEPEETEPAAAPADTPKLKKKKKRKAPEPAESSEEAEAAEPEAEEAEPEEGKPSRGQKKKLKKKAKKADDDAAAEAAAAGPAADEEDPQAVYTIFIDGLPYTWEVQKIRDVFSKCGEIVDVNAPTWQDSGRLRGYGHVSFRTEKAKEEALAMSGIMVGSKGRYLKIEEATGANKEKHAAPDPKLLVGKRRLFVKNLPYDATEKAIGKHFSQYGHIVEIRVPQSFGRSKGFAYVEYYKCESLQKAVEAGAELLGRKLILDADVGSGPKAGFHRPADVFEEGGKGKKGKGKGKGKDKGKKGSFAGRGPKISLF